MISDRLRAIVERIRRLKATRSEITQEIRDVFAEAKAEGFDIKTIRRLLARLDMAPQDRENADALLESYECAVGLTPGEPERPLVDQRPDVAAIALELLTAELISLEDQGQAAALVEHVLALIDIRAEIAVLRAQESDRKKLAKAEGFDAKQIAVTVRWFEKVAKHGEEAMRAGEATFHLYRGTVEGHQAQSGMATERDKALFARFAGEAAATRKTDKRSAAVRDVLRIQRAQRASEGGGILE